MKKTIKLTESDLAKLVKRIVNESYPYEDDDEAHEEYVNQREEITTTIMTMLKPYHEKHGADMTITLLEDIIDMVKEDDPFYYY